VNALGLAFWDDNIQRTSISIHLLSGLLKRSL
jgi:hypothetical protein